ncbi:MAG: malto-oligosyltrehalose synthase [Corynebacterium sp.]|nr:malto-oligosyltrehalose synthase [Corynebacterium sp.]
MAVRPLTATYRIQLRGPQADPEGRAFGFAEAEAILPYLSQLGISHFFLSPIMAADPTSNHGYDVTDPTVINPELGGRDGFEQLAHAVHDAGMGLIIDIVPNHVGIARPELNPWWWDVLKLGQNSQFEPYFDIDWHSDNGAGGRLGLPILGAESDTSAFTADTYNGEPVLRYFDHIFPLDPATVPAEGVTNDTIGAIYERQHYKLMYWRDGVINYRRFFSVNTLAGIRQEDPLVFEHTHKVLRELVQADLIDGVRVDHPDGLADPFGYLSRLREVIGPDRWLVAEKILGADEALDPRLKVNGTTGYDAGRELDGVFVQSVAADPLSMISLKHSGSTWDHDALASSAYVLKEQVAHTELSAEVRRLARAIRRDNFSTAGSTLPDAALLSTVEKLVAAIPVYRADYRSLARTTASVVADMSRRFPSRREALDVIAAALIAGGEAFTRFAQVCGAVMAKGVEDTLFYRASRLIALNEVGGDPGRFGVSAAEFHLLQQERAHLWPTAMTTLSTHDSKRGEDVRARMLEIADAPATYGEFVEEVYAVTPPPHGPTGAFLLQNIVGSWPADGVLTDSYRTRLQAFAAKAIREAGLRTSWVEPDEPFEAAVAQWIDSLLDGPATERITAFVGLLAPAGVTVSWGRKLLQLIAPGIPDTYQGEEYVTDSLVDPDNRRFVDFDTRAATLAPIVAALDAGDAVLPAATGGDRADVVKQAIIATALRVRGEHPECFVGGDYQAVFAQGPTAGHLLGVARGPRPGNVDIIALATRTPLKLAEEHGWQTTTLTLPEGTWSDVLTGRTYDSSAGKVPVADLLDALPTALLVRS